MKYHSISVYQARYATSIVAKCLDTATFKTSTKFHHITLPSDASTSDEQVEKLNREFNIHYRAYIES